MSERKYAVQCIRKSRGGKSRNIGPAVGFSRAGVAKEIAGCLAEKGVIKQISFNHRKVSEAHYDALLQLAELWVKVAAMESAKREA